MNYTDNYNLNLPSFNDSADISALNENFSKIDKKLKENETATGNIKVPTTDQTYKPTSANPQSGKAVAEAIAGVKFTTDTTVKEGSTNPVSGGAVYTALQNVEIDVDNAMSDTSENTVQNKIVKDYVDENVEKFSTYLASANLCDNEWEYGQISSSGGHYGDATNGYRSKNYLPVKGGETIYQNNSTGTSYTIFQYNQDKAIITFGGLNQGAITNEGVLYDRKIVLDANTKYIRIHKAITATSIDLSSVQVNVLYKEDAEKIFNADGSFDYVEPYIYSKDILNEAKNNKTIIEHTYSSTSTNAISGKGVAEALKNVDTTVTEGSTNPVSGGAVYTALQNVEIDVDKYLSDTSTNPVQNKTLKQYIDSEISDAVTSGAISQSGDIRLKPNFANNISECIDTTKLYVLPDGYIYAYMENGTYPEITIQDNYTTTTDGEVVGRGSGYYWYKNGVTEDYHMPDDGLVTSKQTNYIPVTAGDILQYTGKAGCNVLIGSWYDGGKNFLSPIMVAGTSGNAQSLTVTAPDNAKYVRFFASTYTGGIIDHTNKDSYSLEVKWEYCYVATIPQWAKTGNKFIPADYEEEIQDHEKRITDLENKNVDSILKGKKIVYDGDSICAPWHDSSQNIDNGGAYPQLIAETLNGSSAERYYDNQAVGGGVFRTQIDIEESKRRHSIVDNLVNLPTDGDLYCFEGGVNDHWSETPLGDFIADDYTGTLETTTFCGALEAVFRYCIGNFIGKPICFIITHKCAGQGEINKHTFADFRDKMIGICEKYSIPYYDAWKESGLNYWNEAHCESNFIIREGHPKGDKCHPNIEGYKRYYVPQLISLFEKIMPRE